jgi:DNA-binding response OmpR family regulator
LPREEIMKKRILVVDDDTSVRESLKRVLTETGYEVSLASDGAEGEKHLMSQPVDLLILDLNMPNRDGWDVLASTSTDNPLLPVILITGMFNELDTTLIPGISVLMKKPVEVVPLLEHIHALLSESIEERLGKVHAGLDSRVWIRAN